MSPPILCLDKTNKTNKEKTQEYKDDYPLHQSWTSRDFSFSELDAKAEELFVHIALHKLILINAFAKEGNALPKSHLAHSRSLVLFSFFFLGGGGCDT